MTASANFDIPTQTFEISVADTGVGIEEDKLASLFNAFTKLQRNRNLNREGVGLGLVISKNLAEALGGQIFVETVVGRGSKFTIKVPVNPNFSITPCITINAENNNMIVE